MGKARFQSLVMISGLTSKPKSFPQHRHSNAQAFLGVQVINPNEIHVFFALGEVSEEYRKISFEGGLDESNLEKQRQLLAEVVNVFERSFSDDVGKVFPQERTDAVAELKEEAPEYASSPARAPAFRVTPPKPDFVVRKELWDASQVFQKQLKNDGRSMICLAGAPYAGKKEIARRLAWDSKREFPDGAIEIDLDDANVKRSPIKQVLQGILVNLGNVSPVLLNSFSVDQLRELAVRTLEGKRGLLVLHSVESNEQLLSLSLPSSFSLLATSCKLINASGVKSIQVANSVRESAIALAVEIGQERKDFVQHAERLACACGYNLYAVRLAAESIVGNVTKSVASQVKAIERVPLRHLEAISCLLAERYSTLTVSQQRAWRLLSVFESHFTIPQANAVLDFANQSRDAAALLVDYLAKNSLIHFTASNDTFVMTSLERAFLRAKLRQKGEYQGVRRRHAAFHLALANLVSDRIVANPGMLPWMQPMETGDFASAFRWASLNAPAMCTDFLKKSLSFVKSQPWWALLKCGIRGRRAARRIHDQLGEAVCNYLIGVGLVTVRAEPRRIIPYYEAAFSFFKGAELRVSDVGLVALIGHTLAEGYMAIGAHDRRDAILADLAKLLNEAAARKL